MKRWSWLLLLFPALVFAAPGKGRTGVSRGKSLLRGQQPAAAQRLFEAELRKKPGDPDATVGLARALAAQGKCRLAMEHFPVARAAGAWSGDAALDEAQCHLQYGRLSLAEVALEEAIFLNDELDEAWYRLGAVRSARGDAIGLAEVVEALEFRTTRAGSEVLLAWDARNRGDFDSAWEYLWDLQRLQALRPADGREQAIVTLEGTLWMDEGVLPIGAALLQEGLAAHLHDVALSTWRAEAVRREGFPGWAIGMLDRPALRGRMTERAAAVLARAHADFGHHDKAELALRPFRSSVDAEVLATRWYLARATGDSEKMALYADWYEVVPHAGPLDSLIPLYKPPERPLFKKK